MDLTIVATLKCHNCGSQDLLIIGICEGGIIATECQTCESRPGFVLTELLQGLLGGEGCGEE